MIDSEICGIVRRQALSCFHPVTKLRLHQPIGVLSLEKEHYVKKERLLFPAQNNVVKVKCADVIGRSSSRVSATPDACAIRWVAVLWRPVRSGAAQSAGVTVPRAAEWLHLGGWPCTAARAYLGSPAPRSVSGQDVDLHPHKPDPPDQCGRGTDEASRSASKSPATKNKVVGWRSGV